MYSMIHIEKKWKIRHKQAVKEVECQPKGLIYWSGGYNCTPGDQLGTFCKLGL